MAVSDKRFPHLTPGVEQHLLIERVTVRGELKGQRIVAEFGEPDSSLYGARGP
jgi:hypothetical protein